MENNEYNDGRVVVPYDKDRKKITFYDTYVDMDGDIVRYDDIAVIQCGALNSTSFIYVYYGKSFTYNFTFTTYDGTKHNFKRGGYAAYGIGNYKRIKEEYEVVSKPMYNIVINSVAERLISRLESGAKVNICGLEITRDKIVYEKKKKTIVIDRDNFQSAVSRPTYGNSLAQIFVKGEKRAVFQTVLTEPNARLIVPIVNYFFAPADNSNHLGK